jgi:hypothetical protein
VQYVVTTDLLKSSVAKYTDYKQQQKKKKEAKVTTLKDELDNLRYTIITEIQKY